MEGSDITIKKLQQLRKVKREGLHLLQSMIRRQELLDNGWKVMTTVAM